MDADSLRAPGRLLWRCRRGMKELDVILERFAREGLPQASAAERAAFERFLGLADPEIAGCLLAGGHLEDPSLQALAVRIRDLCHGSPVC
ncbi:MAG: succinate dehydrogenase assembly factor 2 [Gammaproteobacteria bacterium]|nr:succinate dehydrogenase assembly factor 2 [Gammaproteobacteria bacterium]